ncbi:MAG: hypothetical protein NZ518_12300, partial [Dehalococcoidia bacterium]|nr:hypothetical protein [Dehalococcoidia bacterium]
RARQNIRRNALGVTMTDDATLRSRIQLAHEILLTDERLRGDLLDDQFQAILAWALPRAEAIARDTADIADPDTAIAAVYDRLEPLKEEMRLAAQKAAESFEAAPMTEPPSPATDTDAPSDEPSPSSGPSSPIANALDALKAWWERR